MADERGGGPTRRPVAQAIAALAAAPLAMGAAASAAAQSRFAYSADIPLNGFLASPQGAAKGAAVVFHEGTGLGDHARRAAEGLASLGYQTLAADLYGVADPTLEQVQTLFPALHGDRPKLRTRARAAVEALAARTGLPLNRICAVGYCMGGAAAIELARAGLDLAAVVAFHGELDARGGPEGPVRAPILALAGADDPLVTAEHRAAFEAEMRAAKADATLVVYSGVGHSFTNPEADKFGRPGIAYDARAATRSWQAMTDFLGERFGGAARA